MLNHLDDAFGNMKLFVVCFAPKIFTFVDIWAATMMGFQHVLTKIGRNDVYSGMKTTYAVVVTANVTRLQAQATTSPDAAP